MFRKLVPLAVAIVLVLGCGKKKDEEGGGGGGGSGEPAPSGPAVTIKIRDEQKGDKVAITETKTTSMSVNATTQKGNVSKTQKQTEKSEYTETVVEMPAGADRATKATREYKMAEKSEDGGPAKSLPYAKKTVLIEKRGAKYFFTVNGVPLPESEAKKFREVYEKADRLKNEDFIPKKPVQVNEKWSLEQVITKKLATEMDLPINAEKSTGTGRLTKTYTKNGQQWGTIELKIDLVLDGSREGLTFSGNLGMSMQLDTAIDGSTLDGVMKMTMTGKIVAKQAAANVTVETTISGDQEETRTTVK